MTPAQSIAARLRRGGVQAACRCPDGGIILATGRAVVVNASNYVRKVSP